jgi:hypothetical protein
MGALAKMTKAESARDAWGGAAVLRRLSLVSRLINYNSKAPNPKFEIPSWKFQI